MADGMLGRCCSVCQRKMLWEELPYEQQQIQILEVVPERYIDADMSEVPNIIRGALSRDIDTGVLLWGAAGVGKTYAMAALAKTYIASGFKVLRVHYEMLCLRLRDTFSPKADVTEFGLIEPYLNCDKLFIEDVGTSKGIDKKETDFSVRTFYVLLEMRLERCRPTFITSNKSLENLTKSFDGRIGDRLRTFKIFKLAGESKR